MINRSSLLVLAIAVSACSADARLDTAPPENPPPATVQLKGVVASNLLSPFYHLVLLPGVQLQKSNARRQIRIGDGINFTVDFSYVYDDRNRPLTKAGDVTILNGPNSGQRVQISSVFSYY